MPEKVHLGKMKTDSFSQNISSTQFSENLLSEYHKTGLFNGCYTMQGNINNKVASFNYWHKRTGLLSKKNIYRGYLGEQETQVVIEKDRITGNVSNKEVNLSVKNNFFGKSFTISGNIGDKEINIQRGTSISEAKDGNDILTLCMSLYRNAINVKNGKFDSLKLSKQADINMQQAMLMNMMAQQQMMASTMPMQEEQGN